MIYISIKANKKCFNFFDLQSIPQKARVERASCCASIVEEKTVHCVTKTLESNDVNNAEESANLTRNVLLTTHSQTRIRMRVIMYLLNFIKNFQYRKNSSHERCRQCYCIYS